MSGLGTGVLLGMLVYLNLKAAALAPRGFRLDRENWSGHGEELKKVEALLKKMP